MVQQNYRFLCAPDTILPDLPSIRLPFYIFVFFVYCGLDRGPGLKNTGDGNLMDPDLPASQVGRAEQRA
jgi:hypothetical protein